MIHSTIPANLPICSVAGVNGAADQLPQDPGTGAARLTHLSTEEFHMLEGNPGCCPSSYYYYCMLNQIWRYHIRLPTTGLFRHGCGHLCNMHQAVFQVLSDNLAIYESMAAELVTKTLWQIFIDGRAREYFSHHGPALRESALFTLRVSIKKCMLKATINCPIHQLLGRLLPPSAALVAMAIGGSSRSSQSWQQRRHINVDPD